MKTNSYNQDYINDGAVPLNANADYINDGAIPMPPTNSASSIGSNALNAALPGLLTANPIGAIGSAIASTPFGQNFGNGAINSLRNIGVGAFQNTIGRFSNNPNTSWSYPALQSDLNNWNNQYQQQSGGTLGGIAGSVTGEIAPYMALGPAAGLGELGGGAMSLLGRMGMGAAVGGLSNALSYSPDPTSTIGGRALGGALGGAIIPAATYGLGKGLGAIGNAFMGSNTGQALQSANDIAQGTNTPVGAVLKSPVLNAAQWMTSKVPLSGSGSYNQKIANQVGAQGQQLLGNLGTTAPADINDTLYKAVQDNLVTPAQQTGQQIIDNLGTTAPADINDTLYKAVQDNLVTPAQQTGQQIIDNLTKGVSQDGMTAQEATKASLLQEYKNALEDKSSVWKSMNDQAQQAGMKVYPTNFNQTIKDNLGSLQGNMLLQKDPTNQALVSKLQDLYNPDTEFTNHLTGQTTVQKTNTNFSDANITQSLLKDASNKAYAAGDTYMSGVYNNIGTGLKQDVKDAVNEYGLQNTYNAANDIYAKNYAPFLDKDVYKYAAANGDPDTMLSTFLKTGVNDRPTQLNKLMGVMSPAGQRALGGVYLNRSLDSDGNVDPIQFGKLMDNLGPQTKASLFQNPDDLAQITAYKNTIDKNAPMFKYMQNKSSDQFLNNFIKTGVNNDRPSQANLLLNNLQPDEKNLAVKGLMSGAMNENGFDPMAFRDIYKNLGPNTKNALMSPDQQKTFDNYAQTIDQNAPMFKYMQNKSSDQFLNNFIKTGVNNDRPSQANLLLNNLQPDEKNLAVKGLMSGAMNENGFDPMAFRDIYKNLGPNTKNALMSPDQQRTFDNYKQLVDMNAPAIQASQKSNLGAHGTGAALEALGTVEGAHHFGIWPALSAAGAGLASAYGLRKMLTSPTIRNFAVQRALNRVPRTQYNKLTGGLLGAIPADTSMRGRQ